MMKYIIGSALLVAFTVPGLATSGTTTTTTGGSTTTTSEQYYVVRDPSTKRAPSRPKANIDHNDGRGRYGATRPGPRLKGRSKRPRSAPSDEQAACQNERRGHPRLVQSGDVGVQREAPSAPVTAGLSFAQNVCPETSRPAHAKGPAEGEAAGPGQGLCYPANMRIEENAGRKDNAWRSRWVRNEGL